MTDNNKLAAIEDGLFVIGSTKDGMSESHTRHKKVRWLIDKVRQLRDENESACEKIKELGVMLENANTAIGTWKGEYARGRADERRDICRWMSKFKWLVDDVPHIERGEHVAEVKDAT